MMDKLQAAADLASAMIDDMLDPSTEPVVRESIRLDPTGRMLARMIVSEIELPPQARRRAVGLFARTRRVVERISITPPGLAGLGQIPWGSILTGVIEGAAQFATASITAQTQKDIARLQIRAAQQQQAAAAPPTPAAPPPGSIQAGIASIGTTVSSLLPWAALAVAVYSLSKSRR